MSGLHRTLRKTSITRRLVGDSAWDKAHFLGSTVLSQADAKNDAKKAAKNADELAQEQRSMQLEQLAQLDEEENRRIKKILVGGRYGARAYRGSPLMRAAPGGTSGSAAAARAAGITPANAGALAAAGARGGLAQSGKRAFYSTPVDA
jgi:hypothetical protein